MFVLPYAKYNTVKRTMRHYAALGAGLVPDCLELRGREKPEPMRLMKVEKQGESKMLYCLEMALMKLAKVEKRVEKQWFGALRSPVQDLWKSRSEKKLRWFHALRWPCASLEKAEQRSSSLKIHISPCVYISAVFISLPHSTISFISDNKRNRKETD